MLAYRHAVRATARRIADAIDGVVSDMNDGSIEQEPVITDRMLGAIRQSLRGFEVDGIYWNAKTLTDRGPGAQEKEYGADFMGALNINLLDFRVTKGFLAQAKRVRKRSSGDLKALKAQCERMLNLSPDSFVFLYCEKGVRVVPAISVMGTNADPLELYQRTAQRFFEEHLQCFIGDKGIGAASTTTLEKLRDRFKARTGIVIQAESGD